MQQGLMTMRCPFCQSPTKYRDPDNATYVYDGQPVCVRKLCRDKAIATIEGVQKSLELGIGFRPEQFTLPLRLNPG